MNNYLSFYTVKYLGLVGFKKKISEKSILWSSRLPFIYYNSILLQFSILL